jgi:hypothetical protein
VGPGIEPSQELRDQLRRRLTLLAVISLCAIGVLAVVMTPGLIWGKDWRYLFIVWLLTALAAAWTAALRRRREMSLRELRGIELATVGVIVAFLSEEMFYTLFDQRLGAIFARLGHGEHVMQLRPLWFQQQGPQTVTGYQYYWIMWALSGWWCLPWVLLLVGYSLFIPNTWKRATIVLCAVASIPILFHGAICVIDPEISDDQAEVLVVGTTATMFFAAALTIFGAHRIEALRREAAAARRLGQYQLKELLGSGGMGEVYRAEHVLLRRPCAIKLIRPERAGDPQNLARFEREVQATATLTHPNTVQVFDYGRAADGTFYYVMEYLPGLTLEELVKRHGPLPPPRAVHILRQVCGALREAHAIGLIHRDIKPGNVIVGERGGLPDVAKLLDFGLVRGPGLGRGDEKLTLTGTLVGTPAYMSPEQVADGEAVDARSDIYSLGAVAYWLLTGRPPFAGKSAAQVMAAHLHEPVSPLTDLRGDIPADLEAVVLRCLKKSPERRFQRVEELEEALARTAPGVDTPG